MMRPHFPRMLLLLALGTAFATAPAAFAQQSWKLYDLRDLIGLVSPTAPGAAGRDDIPVLVDLSARAPVQPSLADSTGNLDQLMGQLCGALEIRFVRLLPGVYGVEAEEAQHAHVLQLLQEIRALYAERYEIEIVWFITAAHQAPPIGDAAVPGRAVHRQRLVVARRTPTTVASTSSHAYVSDLQAVVASGAAAHDPETKSAAGGLRVSVLVGAGEEDAKSTLIQVSGELRQVIMGKMSGTITGGETSSMQVELPVVSVRSIHSNIRMEYGKLIVLGVLDGFDEEECIVMAASVRKLDE